MASTDPVLARPALAAPALQDAATQQARRERWALLLALATIVVWGANFSVQKAVFPVVGPGGFIFLRYLIMPLMAVLLLLWTYGLRWPRIPREDVRAFVLLGLFGHVLHVGLLTYGVHLSTPFSTSLVVSVGPLITLLILRVQGLEQISRAQAVGMGLACAGLLVFLSDKFLGGLWSASAGDLVLILAAGFFAYYTVAAKPLIERHGGVVVLAYSTLLGSPLLVLMSLPAGLRIDWATVSPMVWLAVVWAAAVASFIGWLAWGWINAVRGVARTAPLLYLMPPVAGLIAWALTGESYTLVKLAGAALTLMGVGWAQFAGRPRRDPVREAMPPNE